MSVTCYPSRGKRKALKICDAFAEGCGGRVMKAGHDRLEDGPAFFYGWTDHTWSLIQRCIRERRDWYYCDNAYYYGRGTHFRVTRNALMHTGHGDADGARLEALGVKFAPRQRVSGGVVVVTTQSELFYRQRLGVTRDAWTKHVCDEIWRRVPNQIAVCHKPEPGTVGPGVSHGSMFEEELAGAIALVTHSSSTAVHAICRGVPVHYLGRPCMVEAVATAGLAGLGWSHFPTPQERRAWMRVLAANQWTRDEMRDGTCWRDLQCSNPSIASSSVATAAS